ncbi:PAS domain-containing protein [Halomonas sp. SBBP1]|uniref:PAS domain-containing protein n=1 Tax=Halomonas sp. SBBP1 TaxID=2599306 RepID=UPI001CF58E28|nr:PAS domain-containing protein [Halomonas sp. SBBP1]
MHNAEQAVSAVYELADDEVLISRSDLQGRITYANQTFVDVSGYSLDEIMGEPHSLFRHPSMPKAVLKLMGNH